MPDNFNVDNIDLRALERAAIDIDNGFCWDESLEGHDFWKMIKDRLREISNIKINGKKTKRVILQSGQEIEVEIDDRIIPEFPIPENDGFVLPDIHGEDMHDILRDWRDDNEND